VFVKDYTVGTIIKRTLSKVPAVTLGFWIIKIAATTLGETAGDAVTMSMHLGYAIGSAIFIGIFVVAVGAQIAARSFHPFLYWAVIVATTTAGTAMADFADRSLGIGYTGGAAILFVLLMAALGLWYGGPSCFPKPWARPSVIGWRIRPGSVTKAARWYSARA
jgi:uncharacterized membrane-anchored protein